MKILIVFLVIHIAIASSYILNSVEGVDKLVEAINFDSDGNTYVATSNENSHNGTKRFLHKLSPSRELLWTVELPAYDAYTNAIFVNRQKDIYLHFLGDFILTVLKANSTTFEDIDERVDYLIFMDTDENLIYCKTPNCYVIRPNTTVPIPIKNIDQFVSGAPAEAAFDNEGNIYFMGNFIDDLTTGVVLLTKEALQEEVPYAVVFRNFSVAYPDFVRNFFPDEKHNFWCFLINYDKNEGTIKKIANNSIEIVSIDKERPDIKGVYAKDRIYVVSYDYYHESVPTIFYMTLENEIVDIPQLKNITRQQYFSIRTLADDEGYAYFQTNGEFTKELGSMVVIQPNETTPIPIGFSTTGLQVSRMFLDHNRDVWIFAMSGDVYFLKKGETTGEKIPDFQDTCISIDSNLVTKEIFFSCFSGLYVALESV